MPLAKELQSDYLLSEMLGTRNAPGFILFWRWDSQLNPKSVMFHLHLLHIAGSNSFSVLVT
jgi:hypothetical protein